MNAIEKHIFDTLASGRGVNLPGAGALHVERHPAEFISKGSLRPPYNKIVFSYAEDNSFASAMIDMGYQDWLTKAKRTNGILEINGVGVLREGVFYPSVELYQKLNPGIPESVKVKRKAGPGKKFLVGVGVLVAAGLVLCLVVLIDSWTRRDIDDSKMEMAYQEQRIASEQGEGTIAPVVAPQAQEIIGEEQIAKQEEVVAEDVIQKGLENYSSSGSISAPVYYLVVGVFSTDENADKLIASDPLRIGKDSYGKMPFKGGKILVSAYSSTNKSDVDARRKQLSALNGDLWIYEKK